MHIHKYLLNNILSSYTEEIYLQSKIYIIQTTETNNKNGALKWTETQLTQSFNWCIYKAPTKNQASR